MSTYPDFKFEYKDWKVTISAVESYGAAAGKCETWFVTATNGNHRIAQKSSYVCDAQTLQWDVNWAKSLIDRYDASLDAQKNIVV
jgi:hypothetical protein